MAAARTRNTATVKGLQRRCSRYDGCRKVLGATCTRAARIPFPEFEGGRRAAAWCCPREIRGVS